MGKIIAVDIGNSNIVVGIWNGPSLEFTGRLQTRRDYTEKELREDLAELRVEFYSHHRHQHRQFGITTKPDKVSGERARTDK